MSMFKALSKFFGFFAISALLVGSVYAQGTTERMPGDFGDKQAALIAELKLTPDQEQKAKAIIEDSHKQHMAIVEQYKNETGPMKKKEMRDKLVEVNTQTHEKLKQILTADQMAVLQKYEAEIKADVKANMAK